MFHDPERAEFCVGRFDPLARYASQTADAAQARDWQTRHPGEILLLGTALLVRRTLIDTIGGLDEQFFAYVEDVDYSLRSLAAGFRNVAVADAVVFHKFRQPLEQPDTCPPYLHYFITRNYLLLWRKLPGSMFCKATLWFIRQRLVQLRRLTGDPARRMPWVGEAIFRRCGGVMLALLDRGRVKHTK